MTFNFSQVFPVGPDPPADALGARVARGTAGRHGAVSHRLLGNRAGSRQVTEQPIRALLNIQNELLCISQTLQFFYSTVFRL